MHCGLQPLTTVCVHLLVLSEQVPLLDADETVKVLPAASGAENVAAAEFIASWLDVTPLPAGLR